MKISQMLRREPFGQILEETLTRYWDERYGRPHSVNWCPGWPTSRVSRKRQAEDGQVWLCLPELNIISTTDASKNLDQWVRAVFANTPTRWKRPLLRVYVTGVTQQRIKPLVARAALVVSPSIAEASSVLIYPGNARLRIFDFRCGRVAVLLKAGFDDHAMRRELDVRTANGDGLWPIPPVLSTGLDGTWFEEPILNGVPVNRVSPHVDVLPAMGKAFDVLDRWLKRNQSECSVLEYAERLRASVQDCLGQVSVFDVATRTKVNRWMDSALALVRRLVQETCKSVLLAVGHGDFQPGNILVGGEQDIWILDWEHSEERQYLYDFLVFGLCSRFSLGLSKRLSGLLRGAGRGILCFDELWSYRLPTDLAYLRLLLVVFMLEELAWYVQENSNPLFFHPSGGWLQFSSEMETSLACLARDN